jgi:hypothetical protein
MNFLEVNVQELPRNFLEVDVHELPQSRCSVTSSMSMCRNFLDVQEPPSGTFSFARDFLVGSY